jgi:hypothetical protein
LRQPTDDEREILQRILPLAGDVERALAWYRFEPLPEFGGETAESIVRHGKASSIREFIDHVALGGFA